MTRNTATSPRERLIFALDVAGELGEALRWVDCLKDHVGLFKVGKESFVRFGPRVVEEIRARGGRVFLDLKFHDIPNTVAQACRAAAELGVSMVNLHALGGSRMMEEAVASLGRLSEERGIRPPVLLAVTVLTSLADEDLRRVGIPAGARETAVALARLAREAGLSGVVASPEEASAIREACGEGFLIVTPGIRNARADLDDQKRVLSAAEAIAAGADYLVVGRPIRLAEDPRQAAREFMDEIARGLALRERGGKAPPS